ncbi:MAG: hypothetical protein KKC79_07080 [Gammaproteobacteria bacterium]|nr:hypothetical protein [Gammaproteobacteria bacterium]MBU1441655.1 hypothetical protein [Gammaproteobacteria bacterium]MBU2287971.1 hypothetical protein [Gammaproteobacteria bacterium]MBU2408398.1 hypothetical protein [Gammaproteobacteria bacterium]
MTRVQAFALAGVLATMLALSGCTALKPAGTAPTPSPPSDEKVAAPADVPTVRLITAQTPAVRAYRKLGAKHIYAKYSKMIYKGRIPPLVYAVVVTETDLDKTGRVTGVHFSRTPSHAPEVSGKIAELIREASPFPNPGALGGHTYVDVWLWDKSGKFQLDTLTEGQRSR